MKQTWVCGLFCVNVCVTRYILTAVIVFANTCNVSTLTLKTEDNDLHLHEETELVLNCTYHKKSNEDIENRDIRWQKWIGNNFKDVALFSPPGGTKPYINGIMESLYNNRTELIAPTESSLSAVLILKELVCDDVGVYRCWVDYFSKNRNYELTSLSTVALKATKPSNFGVFPYELQENQTLTLSCSAYVGAPNGNIKIWKIARNSTTNVLIFTANTSDFKTENCSEFINATFTYTVSRDDNGAMFLCSSQNVLNEDEGPSLESQIRVSVKYGPGKPSIVLTPNKSSYYVGEDIRLQCVSDSNPPYNITWSFLPFNHSTESSVFSYEIELKLKDIQLENAGNYTCTAVNEISTNNNTAVINVKEPLENNKRTIFSCDQCGFSEICEKKNGEEYCVTSPWMFVAIIFIFLCALFFVAIYFLRRVHRKSILHKSSTKKTSPRPESLPLDSPHHPSESAGLLSESGIPILGPTPDDTEAGYSTPKDVREMHEQSAMLPPPDERAEITTTCNQENTQYAEVQKKQQTENVYDPDWNENELVNLAPEPNILNLI
uniref:Nectin-1-like isoform X1 n=2 Tax=Crassostrea virginica TaxID=6565 RepID=A0A8B8ADI2_CRAVI|nr:nectin-1-like isoform X1 [Crassostrea virginica]